MGEGHTFCNPLSKELWNDNHVKVSGYHIKHSLISNPVMIVETDGSESARNAMEKGALRLKKKMDEFKSKFKKIK